ncbi:phosphoribosylglycinamide formyltransferase [Lactobacillus corticis]|uniref:Phosphoribosylglycinamide formyltransferase n=1 Tax=Lactobacillus corticis TaxID=2201249 RepID=A0A916QIJ2_9LACO|nr:phosphoribosylglycinamide formyltransferase [Lactobacillus corticis]GFZ26722.1 phosphoribosylglycinamide formyltransferase [Lactobacillus corticis]
MALRVAILASGNGTNFEALTKAFQAGNIPGQEVLLFANHHDAPVLARAKRLGVPAECFTVKECGSKEAYEQRLLKLLKKYQVDFILLAGYLRIVGPAILAAYPEKIINLHPALLPKYPGLDSIERAYRAGEKYTGVTVHFIDQELDHGPVIAQEKVVINPDDTLETLTERVHETEHRLFPKAVSQVLAAELAKEKQK